MPDISREKLVNLLGSRKAVIKDVDPENYEYDCCYALILRIERAITSGELDTEPMKECTTCGAHYVMPETKP